jgi:hypothetical protein
MNLQFAPGLALANLLGQIQAESAYEMDFFHGVIAGRVSHIQPDRSGWEPAKDCGPETRVGGFRAGLGEGDGRLEEEI